MTVTTHHLHTCFISYNRPELLKRAYETYKATVSLPHTVVIVDNGSEAETVDWLTGDNLSDNDRVILNGQNLYPGAACNLGWSMLPQRTTLLHRADNDFIFLPYWCDEVLRCLLSADLGQLGLRTDEEELHAEYNVGGNNIIRRKLWDQGLRYDERPWNQYPKGLTEDTFFTPEVERRGYSWGRVQNPCIVPISRENPDDPYYQETWGVRGIRAPQ